MTLLFAATGINTLIQVLIALIVIAVIIYVAKLILDSIPAPPVVRTITYLVLFLIVILVLLNYLGIWA